MEIFCRWRILTLAFPGLKPDLSIHVYIVSSTQYRIREVKWATAVHEVFHMHVERSARHSGYIEQLEGRARDKRVWSSDRS